MSVLRKICSYVKNLVKEVPVVEEIPPTVAPGEDSLADFCNANEIPLEEEKVPCSEAEGSLEEEKVPISKDEVPCYKRTEEEEQKVKALLRDLEEKSFEFTKGLPLWMRCNFLLNKFASMQNDYKLPFEEIEKKVKINWGKINELLAVKNGYEYNLFTEVHSIQEVIDLRGAVMDASIIDNLPYYKQKCRQCGEEFTLSLGEINWYQNKNLEIPHRCKYCRKGIQKKAVVVPKPEPIETIPEKTSMQIAFEKAGIKLD